jgi:hypothetical protein
LTTGKAFLTLLTEVLARVPATVESLATPDSLLPPAITENLRRYLPESPTGGPISMLDVIGVASGYLIDEITYVNSLIQQLYETKYGPQIRTALTEVSQRYNQYFIAANPDSEAPAGVPAGPAERLYQQAVDNYRSLLVTIVLDPATSAIASNINETWSKYCEKLGYEVVNYNKANITPSDYTDNSIIYSFVESLPSYAADAQNIGTDLLLYGLCQNNQSGDIVKTILGQFKNNQTLSNVGVRISGIV